MKKENTASSKLINLKAAGKKELLRARARALAQRLDREEPEERHLDVLLFLLSHETYAVELERVREVVSLKELTPVPWTPAFVLGIINVRGEILSVIDLGQFFDLPYKGLTELNKVIALYSDEMEFGILADEILGVRSVPFSEIQISPSPLTDVRSEYLRGVTAEGLIIIDGLKILSDKRMIIHEE